jgi:hypothetical protein
MHHMRRRIARVLGLTVLGVCLISVQVRAGASVSVSPSLTEAGPGDTLTVIIYKDSVDITFDGYETVVAYDPAVLRYLSAAEGSVMVNACWNRWFVVSPDTGTVFISHVLMCGGTATQGPGALSTLTFEAQEPGTTAVSADYFWFTLSGLWIKDVDWHDGLVYVNDQAGIGNGSDDGESTLSIEAWPNPAAVFDIVIRSAAVLGARSAPPPLEIFDVRGRAVARPSAQRVIGAGWDYIWDGTDTEGAELPAGVYFARATGPGGSVCKRIVLVR